MFTPADTEALHRLRPMLAAAVSKATNDEEHAVSEVTPEMIHKEKLQKNCLLSPALNTVTVNSLFPILFLEQLCWLHCSKSKCTLPQLLVFE